MRCVSVSEGNPCRREIFTGGIKCFIFMAEYSDKIVRNAHLTPRLALDT